MRLCVGLWLKWFGQLDRLPQAPYGCDEAGDVYLPIGHLWETVYLARLGLKWTNEKPPCANCMSMASVPGRAMLCHVKLIPVLSGM